MHRLSALFATLVLFLALLPLTPAAGAQELDPQSLLQVFPEAPDVSQPISRGAFAALLVKAAGLPLSGSQNDLPRDVDKQSWFTPALLALKEKGIMRGYPDGTMRPLNPLSRLEAVVLAARTLGLPDTVSKANEVPVLPEDNWGYAPYSWLLSQRLLSDKDDPLGILTIGAAADFLTKVFGSDPEALAIVEKAQQAQTKIKGVSFQGDFRMIMQPRSDSATKEFPEMRIKGRISTDMVLPATLHQSFQMHLEIPGGAGSAGQMPPQLEMEQYLVEGVMYQKLTDPQTGKSEWVRLPKEMTPDIGAIIEQGQKANVYRRGIPEELRPYFHYQLLGTTTLAGQQVYQVGYYGRIDDFNAFFKLAVPETVRGMIANPEFQESIKAAGDLIKSISYWGIDYIGVDNYLAYAGEFKAVVAYKDKFLGQPFPLETMEIQMKIGKYTYGDGVKIQLPPEAQEAKELPLPE
ncbi:MAG: hypothetical protein PWP65_1636, partial [Clostridia bacterium]|nr:hypothetical protein [Clostridia bacterium]